MALSAGDVLYYDGSKWVNSSTVVSTFLTIQGQTIFLGSDTGTNTAPYPAQLRHTSTGTAAPGFGVGLQWFGQESSVSKNPVEIAVIRAHESNPAQSGSGVMASYLILRSYSGGSSGTNLALGDWDATSAGVYCAQPVSGWSPDSVPFRFRVLTKDMTGVASPYTLASSEYQCPIIKFTNAAAAKTIVFPATAGGFWIIYNNSGQTLTLNPGTLTLNNNLHGIYYADGTNLQQITTPA